MSEAGEPLLYSRDETAYDDAAYLVDRTFDRPYQFTGVVNRRNRSALTNRLLNANNLPASLNNARYFAVKPVMERDSEYNRASSINDSDHSQLSFRPNQVEMSSDSQSN